MNERAGRLLPTGTDIVVRIHYKKTWITQALTSPIRVRLVCTLPTATPPPSSQYLSHRRTPSTEARSHFTATSPPR